MMLSAVEAEAAVPKVEVSEACTASEEAVAASTVILAVMTTLPASTAMVTKALSTPAAEANLSCSKEVSA